MNDCSAATASLDDLDALIDVGGCFSFRSVTKRPVAWQQGARGRKRERSNAERIQTGEQQGRGRIRRKGSSQFICQKSESEA